MQAGERARRLRCPWLPRPEGRTWQVRVLRSWLPRPEGRTWQVRVLRSQYPLPQSPFTKQFLPRVQGEHWQPAAGGREHGGARSAVGCTRTLKCSVQARRCERGRAGRVGAKVGNPAADSHLRSPRRSRRCPCTEKSKRGGRREPGRCQGCLQGNRAAAAAHSVSAVLSRPADAALAGARRAIPPGEARLHWQRGRRQALRRWHGQAGGKHSRSGRRAGRPGSRLTLRTQHGEQTPPPQSVSACNNVERALTQAQHVRTQRRRAESHWCLQVHTHQCTQISAPASQRSAPQ